MPWCQKAMKDAASCDKLRLAASKRKDVGFRMGQPNSENAIIVSKFII